MRRSWGPLVSAVLVISVASCSGPVSAPVAFDQVVWLGGESAAFSPDAPRLRMADALVSSRTLYWPAVARGDEDAVPAMRDWAVKLEAKSKYVVSSTRTDFPWTNSHHIAGDLRTSVQNLKEAILQACSSAAANSRPNWTGWI